MSSGLKVKESAWCRRESEEVEPIVSFAEIMSEELAEQLEVYFVMSFFGSVLINVYIRQHGNVYTCISEHSFGYLFFQFYFSIHLKYSKECVFNWEDL